jgi:hypothetical protein
MYTKRRAMLPPRIQPFLTTPPILASVHREPDAVVCRGEGGQSWVEHGLQKRLAHEKRIRVARRVKLLLERARAECEWEVKQAFRLPFSAA